MPSNDDASNEAGASFISRRASRDIDRLEALALAASDGDLFPTTLGENGTSYTDHASIIECIAESVRRAPEGIPCHFVWKGDPGSNGFVICHTGNGPTSEANAAFFSVARRNTLALIAMHRDLVAALEHIAEYWNRDQNETAMADALWHIIEVAEAEIAKVSVSRVTRREKNRATAALYPNNPK